jgi:hypothetical protein
MLVWLFTGKCPVCRLPGCQHRLDCRLPDGGKLLA